MVIFDLDIELTNQDMMDTIRAHAEEICATLPRLSPISLESLLMEITEMADTAQACVADDLIPVDFVYGSSPECWSYGVRYG